MNTPPRSRVRGDFDFSSPERTILDRAPCKAGNSKHSRNYYIDTTAFDDRRNIYRNVEPVPFKI